MRRFIRTAGGITLLTLVAFVGGMCTGTIQTLALSDETYEALRIFNQVLRLIEVKYVEEVDPHHLIEGAIQGMLATLDPHSSYMPPDIFQELNRDTIGEFGGLGIEITVENGILTVIAPIEDTPAEAAGIEPGDQILEIDGESTEGFSILDAVKRIRGPVGTEVVLTILRKGEEEPREVTIKRSIIRVTSVRGSLLEPHYAYVRISQFQSHTSADLETTLLDLEATGGGLKGLVLDLRNNPGGLLDEAIKVCDLFLEEGLIVYTMGRTEDQNMKRYAQQNGTHSSYPVVVLINEGSASASEIVAGALQDHGRALILGVPSFGKGSVQTIIPLDDGSGLRLTTAKYFTPKGRDIQARGISPDIFVATDDRDLPTTPARGLREADLAGHLENESEGEGGGRQPPVQDIQLKRALDLLKSWEIFQGARSAGAAR
ncbi:MAG: S41 family peptidase [Deltaproteobacteria bacterium]|nr:MAG: S41 family peptidase [Deltaproteobacteria bacterium]